MLLSERFLKEDDQANLKSRWSYQSLWPDWRQTSNTMWKLWDIQIDYIYMEYMEKFEYLFLLYLDIEFIIWYESFMKIGKLVNCEEWISPRQFSCMHEHKNEIKGSMKIYVALFVVWIWFVIVALVVSIAILTNLFFWTLTRVIKTDSSTFFQFRSGRVHSQKFGRTLIL